MPCAARSRQPLEIFSSLPRLEHTHIYTYIHTYVHNSRYLQVRKVHIGRIPLYTIIYILSRNSRFYARHHYTYSMYVQYIHIVLGIECSWSSYLELRSLRFIYCRNRDDLGWCCSSSRMVRNTVY